MAIAQAHRPRPLAAWLAPDAPDPELLAAVLRYYREVLTQNFTALGWLAKRGLNSPDMIEHFRLGYADRSLGLCVPEKNRMAGAAVRTKLERVGLYRPSGHEHFTGCVVLPITDKAGAIVQAYGHKLNRHLHVDTQYDLWLPRPPHVWNLGGLSGQKAILVTRTAVDALTLWCAGYRAVTFTDAIAGDAGVLVGALRDLGAAHLTIAMSADDAAVATAVRDAAAGAGMGVWNVALPPKGMSANKYVQRHKKPDVLGHLLAQAAWVGHGPEPERPLFEVGPIAVTAPLPTPTAPNTTDDATAATPDDADAAVELPEAPVPSMDDPPVVDTIADEVIVDWGDRRYRVRGLLKNTSFDLLKVNVAVFRGEDIHIDTLDLYSSKQRQAFVRQAASELHLAEDAVRADIGRLLRHLEVVHERHVRAAIEPAEQAVVIPPERRERSVEFLKSPDLLDRIVADFETCGLVGERENKLLSYIAAVSRKLDDPLAVLIQSSSAAGKSSLLEATLAFVPPEDRMHFSELTGQSLYYLGPGALKNKLLAVAEDRGVERAGYALKLLQSEGGLTIASTGKDDSGKMVTEQYAVEGPVAIMLTSTAAVVDAELQNRCLVLTVDEAREQTRAIHDAQREADTLEGVLRRRAREDLLQLHHDAQRLLQPLVVVNPFAPQLRFVDDRTRTRRDHQKYLHLIKAIALLRQYQRPILSAKIGAENVEYIEVTLNDITVANRLAHHVLGRSLDDLAPTTRRLLLDLHGWVSRECKQRKLDAKDFRFTRRQAREALPSWGFEQTRVHLARLVDFEYLIQHRGGRGQPFEFELCYDGGGIDGEHIINGLVDASSLRTGEVTGAYRPETGPEPAPNRGGTGGHFRGSSSGNDDGSSSSIANTSENARPGVSETTPVVGVGEDRGGRP